MQLHELKRRTPLKKKMIVGRGGKRGKTSGRGGKGQTARAGHKMRPELRDIIKKLPKLRGHGKNRARTVVAEKPLSAVINLSAFEGVFQKGDAVTPAVLVEKGLVKKRKGSIPHIKVLGTGDFTKAIALSGCAVSASAKEKIEKAGGTVSIS